MSFQLTAKQQAFSLCIASGMSKAQAYRESYDVPKDSRAKWIRDEASLLAQDPGCYAGGTGSSQPYRGRSSERHSV
jgi:hypothetical protein